MYLDLSDTKRVTICFYKNNSKSNEKLLFGIKNLECLDVFQLHNMQNMKRISVTYIPNALIVQVKAATMNT